MVVGRAGSHFPGAIYHHLHGARSQDRQGAVEANAAALLRHFHDVVLPIHLDYRFDRGDAARRALVAGMAYPTVRAAGPLPPALRVAGAALRVGYPVSPNATTESISRRVGEDGMLIQYGPAATRIEDRMTKKPYWLL